MTDVMPGFIPKKWYPFDPFRA